MIDFLKLACEQLNIAYIEKEGMVMLNIPTKWQTELGGEQFECKVEELIATHYFIQRLAKLLSANQCHISYAKRKKGTADPMIAIWLKVTIQKSVKEEILKGYIYNYRTGEVVSIRYGSLAIFDEIDKSPPSLDMEAVEKAYDAVTRRAAEDAGYYIQMKQHEEDIERDLEIARIETYYSLLAKERSTAETAEEKEEMTQHEEKLMLQAEKEHLIEQQRIKHHIRTEETHIEPISILVIAKKE